MKDLKSIKLTQLDQVQLEERKMSYLVGGGDVCNCGCYYANSGGSSTEENRRVNIEGGLTSYPTPTPPPPTSCFDKCEVYFKGEYRYETASSNMA